MLTRSILSINGAKNGCSRHIHALFFKSVPKHDPLQEVLFLITTNFFQKKYSERHCPLGFTNVSWLHWSRIIKMLYSEMCSDSPIAVISITATQFNLSGCHQDSLDRMRDSVFLIRTWHLHLSLHSSKLRIF